MRLVPLAALLVLLAPGAGADEIQPELLTRAEATEFRATSSYEETLDFVRRLAAISSAVRLASFGESAQGRPLPLVIVSGSGAFSAEAATAAGRPVVLIQSGIHAGEIDGKDASLMLLRDLALGREPGIANGMVLLLAPIYNADGHERVSPHNRPNQDGPVEGMGFRTTADGHDLNRDHLKLETPEARALIDLVNLWRPHLHVDNHVTDGSDHDWVLTYAWAEAPQAPPSVDAWLAERMPRVIEATREAGHRLGPYVSLLDPTDPARGFDSIVGEPRYSTGYFPLRNRPSILVENHSYKPYRDRVLANRDFLLALLREIARGPGSLVEAVAAAERRTIALGRADAPPSAVTLRYRRGEPGTIRFPVYDWFTEPSTALGVPLLRFRRGEVREIEVPWLHRLTPDLTVPRPRGYLILPGWPVIERRLRDHGLRIRRLARGAESSVETLRISEARKDDDRRRGSYQGLTQVDVAVERRIERRLVPTGTLWVPADQPDFEVAVQLLEPEAPDSLVSWGLLSIVMERKESIDRHLLEDLARGMLQDPAIAAEWNAALADPAFAVNPDARFLWWYRRTKHWDETVGLLPILRLLSAPDFTLSP